MVLLAQLKARQIPVPTTAPLIILNILLSKTRTRTGTRTGTTTRLLSVFWSQQRHRHHQQLYHYTGTNKGEYTNLCLYDQYFQRLMTTMPPSPIKENNNDEAEKDDSVVEEKTTTNNNGNDEAEKDDSVVEEKTTTTNNNELKKKRPHCDDEATNNNNDERSDDKTSTSDNGTKGKGNTWKKTKKKKNSANEKGSRNSRKNNTWMKNLDYDDNAKSRDEPPHIGSFANPAMRKQFDVVLEEDEDEKVVDDKEEKDSREKSDREVKNVDSSNDKGEINKNEDRNKDKDKSKKKVALLVGFLGTKYGGFQMNPDQRTLQAEIELALFKAGMISKSNYGTPHKYSWSNAARTDKGVHACAQVCSLKIELPTNEWDNNINGEERLEGPRLRVEKHLPNDIRILDLVRTTRNFCAKTQRDRVLYSYFFPSFLLHPDWKGVMDSQGINMKTVSRRQQEEQQHQQRDNDNYNNPRMPLSSAEAKKLHDFLKGYRSTEESRNKLKDALRKYEGTHSFHNFTKGLKPGMATAVRYIISFETQNSVIVDGMEWIPTRVLGQSFLLHQIRKMICVAIDVARGSAPIEFMTNALLTKSKGSVEKSSQNLALHVAPPHGLFLEMSFFEGYNRRKNSQTNHDLLDLNWTVDGTPSNNRWIELRDTVRSHIVQEEINQMNFIHYMFLHEYVYGCRKVYDSVGSFD